MKKSLSLNIKRLEKARTSSKDNAKIPSAQQIGESISGGISGGFSPTGNEGNLYDPSLTAVKNHENFKNHIAGLIKNNNFSEALLTSKKIVDLFKQHSALARKEGNVAVAREYEKKLNVWSDFTTKLQQKIGQNKDEKNEAFYSETPQQTSEKDLHDKADTFHDLIDGSKNVKEAISNAHDAAQYFINKFSGTNSENLIDNKGSALSADHKNIAKKYAQYFLNMAESTAPAEGADEELWQQNTFNPEHPLYQERMAYEQLSPSQKKKTQEPVHPREHALDYPVGMEISRPDISTTQTSPRKLDNSVIQLYSKLLTGKDDVLLSPEQIQEKIDDLKASNPDLAKRVELNNVLSNENFEENHFQETNQKRASQGLPPLERHEHLSGLKAIRFILNNPIANPEERSSTKDVNPAKQQTMESLREDHPIAGDISNNSLLQHFRANDLYLAGMISEAQHKKEHDELQIKNAQRAEKGLAPLPAPKQFNILQAAADIIFPNSRAGGELPPEPDFLKPGKRRNDPKLQLQYQQYREKIAAGNYYNPVESTQPVPDTPEVRQGLEQGSTEYFDPKNNPRQAAEAAAADIHRRISATKTAGAHTVVGDKTPSAVPPEQTVPSASELPPRSVDKPTAVSSKNAPKKGRLTEQISSINSLAEIPDTDPEFFNTRQVASQITEKAAAKKGRKPKAPQTEKSMEKSAEQAKNPSFLEKRREGATAQPPKEEKTIGNYSEHLDEQKTVNDKPYKQQGFGSVTKLKAMVSKLKSK